MIHCSASGLWRFSTRKRNFFTSSFLNLNFLLSGVHELGKPFRILPSAASSYELTRCLLIFEKYTSNFITPFKIFVICHCPYRPLPRSPQTRLAYSPTSTSLLLPEQSPYWLHAHSFRTLHVYLTLRVELWFQCLWSLCRWITQTHICQLTLPTAWSLMHGRCSIACHVGE